MQEWKALAQEGEGVGVSRCPAGHIHVDYGHVTLRFTEEGFHTFAAMVGRAAPHLGGAQLPRGSSPWLDDAGTAFSKN